MTVKKQALAYLFVGEALNAASLVFERRFSALLSKAHVPQIPNHHFSIGCPHYQLFSTKAHGVHLNIEMKQLILDACTK